jgi:Ser/Thr protein kinase RdoA (MazF antagonist)
VQLPVGLREQFALDPARFVPLPGGQRHAMFRCGDVVVRFELDPRDQVAWQYELTRFLSERVPEVVAPLADEDGVSVWPFVPGRLARRLDRDDSLAAAELLRRLHDAGRAWTGGQKPGARTTPGDGERGPIHGDYYRANLIVRRRTIRGLVDWEESCVDLLDYELANAVWEFCKSKRTHDFDRALAAEMMAVYGSPLEPDDLVPLILVRRHIELDLWDGAYRRHTRHAIANLSA